MGYYSFKMPKGSNLRISSSNHYVTVTANNRIKVWKLECLSHTKNEVSSLMTELFEPNYLKIHYTAICIFDDDSNKNALIALGDKIGRIIVFNITQSRKVLEISHHSMDASKDFKHCEGGHHSRINSIAFDADQTILTCSNDKKLCRWDLNGKLMHTLSVGEDIPSSLTMTKTFKSMNASKKKKDSKFLLIASNNINVWNVSNSNHCKQIGSFQGHASQTRKLRISDDNNYLISSGQQRFVYVWKCKSFYKKKADLKANKLRSAEYSLPCDDDVICIDILTKNETLSDEEIGYLKTLQTTKKQKNKKKKSKEIGTTKSVYYILAASKSTVYIWCFDPLKQHLCNDANSLQPVVEVSISDIVSNQIAFIDAEHQFVGKVVLENVTASFDDKSQIALSNQYEQEQSLQVDDDLTVLHVADQSRANPKLYD